MYISWWVYFVTGLNLVLHQPLTYWPKQRQILQKKCLYCHLSCCMVSISALQCRLREQFYWYSLFHQYWSWINWVCGTLLYANNWMWIWYPKNIWESGQLYDDKVQDVSESLKICCLLPSFTVVTPCIYDVTFFVLHIHYFGWHGFWSMYPHGHKNTVSRSISRSEIVSLVIGSNNRHKIMYWRQSSWSFPSKNLDVTLTPHNSRWRWIRNQLSATRFSQTF